MTKVGLHMTNDGAVWDKIDEYKYAIMYYVYFVSCLLVALILANPSQILASIL